MVVKHKIALGEEFLDVSHVCKVLPFGCSFFPFGILEDGLVNRGGHLDLFLVGELVIDGASDLDHHGLLVCVQILEELILLDAEVEVVLLELSGSHEVVIPLQVPLEGTHHHFDNLAALGLIEANRLLPSLLIQVISEVGSWDTPADVEALLPRDLLVDEVNLLDK